jgi:tetratricopeptide (TPR) repeat protein
VADRRATIAVGVGLLVAIAVGCGSRPVPPVVTSPRYPDFLFPSVPSGTPERLATRIQDGWRYLQADDTRSADREFEAALKQQPQWAPAETALAYSALARRRGEDALAAFDRALASASSYVPALVGRGHALVDLKRDGEAAASFEAALKADPTLTDLQGRIDVLRFRAAGDTVARATSAASAGRLDEARRLYEQAIAASPESAFLHRDLGAVERRAGQTAAAADHLRRAVQLDPSDARAHAALGGVLDELGDVVSAVASYERARALDPEAVPDRTLTRSRELASLAKLPPEYRSIAQVPQLTRGELAALIGVRLDAVVSRLTPQQMVITDSRGHWAQAWITSVVRAGLMEPLPNYAFDPDGLVRRGDFARVVARTLAALAATHPERARPWEGVRVKIADVPPEHLAYPAVSAAVASGVLTLDGGMFGLLQPVTGADALQAIARIERLARP